VGERTTRRGGGGESCVDRLGKTPVEKTTLMKDCKKDSISLLEEEGRLGKVQRDWQGRGWKKATGKGRGQRGEGLGREKQANHPKAGK